MKKQSSTIDDYIDTFPVSVQTILEKVRQTIRETVPDAKEKIAYGIPNFELKDINLISFAGWKNYISIYPIPAGDKAFQRNIQQYRKAKSTLQFPLEEPIPFELIHQTATFLKKEKV